MEKEQKWFKENLIEIGENSKEIEFEVPVEIVTSEYDKIVDYFTQRAKIPGFRVGKAPKDIIRRVYAAEIRQKLIDNLVPKAVEESLKANNLNPAVDPMIENIRWQEGEPLTFRVKLDFWPDFKLPDYRSIKIPQPSLEVKDEEIEKVLRDLQERSAEFIPVTDRGLAPGDYAHIEIKAKDFKTKKFWPTQKVQIEIGQPTNDPFLEQNIMGLMTGETRTFTVDYPLDHSDFSLAGKRVEYTVKILAIREKRVPAIGDDFARSLGNFDNLDQLRDRIKEELLEKKKEESRNQVLEKILSQLAAEAPFSLPEAAVEAESRLLLERWLTSRPEHNWSEAEIKSLQGEARRQAEKRLKDRLILEKIAQKEGLEVKEDELEEEIRSLARAHRLSFFELKERLEREGRLEALRHNLLLRKVVDFLINQAL